MSIPPLKGRVWVFGDMVDTDNMFPGRGLRLPPEEAAQLLFDGMRPGWANQVSPGDIIVGGAHFGMGSARPVGTLLRLVGVAAVVASSMSSIFQRNCVNAGLLAVPVPGVAAFCREGDILEIDAEVGVVRNITDGSELEFAPIPAFVSEIVASGGIISQLTRGGYLRG
jgi:3-isopropylmalate/(R)-2-methylmalate dehydratase small subunit